jgi:hypothetical protein
MKLGLGSHLKLILIFVFAYTWQSVPLFAKTDAKNSTKEKTLTEKNNSDLNQKTITYSLTPKLKWKQEVDLDDDSDESDDSDDFIAFHLVSNKEISLSFSFIHRNLLSEMKSKDQKNLAETFAQKMIDEKNLQYSSLRPFKESLVIASQESNSESTIITFQSQMKTSDGTYNQTEKYFLYQGETLRVLLSWNSKIDATLIKDINAELGNIKVEAKSFELKTRLPADHQKMGSK